MERKKAKVQLIRQEQVYSLAFRFSLQVEKADFRQEVIVAIARGGFVPARYPCDFLDIYTLASFRIKHYEAGLEQEKEAVIASHFVQEKIRQWRWVTYLFQAVQFKQEINARDPAEAKYKSGQHIGRIMHL